MEYLKVKEIIMKEDKRNSNSLARFTSEMLIEKAGSKITKDEMYNQFCHYCTLQKPKLSPCSKNNLGRQLQRFASFISDSSDGKKRGWLNVEIISKENLTDITNSSNLCLKIKEGIKESKKESKSKQYIFKKPVISVTPKIIQKTISKVSRKKVTKIKTDREVQFYDAKECEDIKSDHTEKEILEWIKLNPKKDFKELYKKFGDGCLKFKNELKKQGAIK